MEDREAAAAFLLEHCARYPRLRPQDALKALHQSAFGCGHLIENRSAAAAEIRKEARGCSRPAGPAIEPLGGEYCRVHLAYLAESGLKPETLAGLFVLSAKAPAGGEAELEEKLAVLLELAGRGLLPFSFGEAVKAVSEWREAGFPARRHSEEYRSAYAPAYRVLHCRQVRLLPLAAELDRLRERKDRVLVAIDGGSASGKTTLASELKMLYDCNVFHMDDFYLRPEQRTAERYAEPGGNVDRERFFEEVLLPLSLGRPVLYRPFDCRTFTIGEGEKIAPKPLNVIEGAYSMHPALADSYDFSVFLKIPPRLQRDRILERNAPEEAKLFFERWIPLEERYFEATRTAERCGLLMEADAASALNSGEGREA